MRKRFIENRTCEEAYMIAEQRIKDAIQLYDKYKDCKEEYFVERPCPICGETKYTKEEAFQERYGVARCVRCHSRYVNPCPTQEVLNDYYNNYECNVMLEAVYKKRATKEKSAILDSRVEMIIKYMEKIEREHIKILEVGCSNGGFLLKVKNAIEQKKVKKSVEFIGIDVDENAIKMSVDDKLCLIASTAEEYLATTEEKFDIIWHAELMEHLIDPYSVFLKMHRVLNDNGYMIFSTPNDASLEMEYLSYNIPRVLAGSIYPPMHLNAFSTQNISHFIMRCGFSVVDILTPGNFDVEILEIQKQYVDNENINKFETLEEPQKELLQNIIAMSRGSSHMQCVVTKN